VIGLIKDSNLIYKYPSISFWITRLDLLMATTCWLEAIPLYTMPSTTQDASFVKLVCGLLKLLQAENDPFSNVFVHQLLEQQTPVLLEKTFLRLHSF